MFEFAQLWLLALLPLPLLVRRLLPPHHEPREGLRVPFIDRLERATGGSAEEGQAIAPPPRIQRALTWVCWILIVVALARPQWLGETQSKTIPSRDLLLAIDLSASMSAEDFTDEEGKTVDRLTAVKGVLDEFLTRRKDDRVGMIFFGSAAFIQVPFIEDVEVCRQLLEEAQVGMAGPKTVIGDAIGLGITVFEKSDLEDRVVILLTDGNDSGSKVPPANAAKLAADFGIVIHTIVVGDPTSVGEAEIDEEVLKEISNITSGTFYRADDRAQLEDIYTQIDALATRDIQTLTHRPTTQLFHWPVGLLILLVLTYHSVALVRARLRARELDQLDDTELPTGASPAP